MELRFARLLAATLGIAITAACTVTATAPRVAVRAPEMTLAEVVVARPPPPAQAEEVPPPPHGGRPESYVWQPGYWRWDGNDYHWYAGRYEKRPPKVAVWRPSEWQERNGAWVFKPGHWVYR